MIQQIRRYVDEHAGSFVPADDAFLRAQAGAVLRFDPGLGDGDYWGSTLLG